MKISPSYSLCLLLNGVNGVKMNASLWKTTLCVTIAINCPEDSSARKVGEGSLNQFNKLLFFLVKAMTLSNPNTSEF